MSLPHSDKLGEIVHQFDNLSKLSGTIELNFVESVFVSLNYSFYSITFRIKNVSVNCKTVRSSMLNWRYFCSVAEERDLLILVVVLQNRTD